MKGDFNRISDNMAKEKDIKEIIRKYSNDECTPHDLDDAISILSEPYENLKLRPTLFNQWNNNEEYTTQELKEEELSSMLDQVHHRINIEKTIVSISTTKRLLINLSKIAAILIVGLMIGFLVQKYSFNEPMYYTSFAPKGSISQVLLPDNTMVYLNSGSEIKYTIEGVNGNREVFLTGEAWFQVEKNEEKPFVVHTPYYKVNVLGTEFNVKAYTEDNEITTTLEKGRIQITSAENFQIQSNTVLNPGEQLIYNKEQNTIQLKAVKPSIFSSWKENKLIFINMSLKELITMLERKYGVDIEVTDASILDYHYDGTIKDESIIEVMDILKHSLPISYKIEEQKLIIIKN